MWFSAYLEVNRLDLEGKDSALAKSSYVKLMIESKKIDKLLSLPLDMPLVLLEGVLESTSIAIIQKREIMTLASIVMSDAEQFDRVYKEDTNYATSFAAIARTYENSLHKMQIFNKGRSIKSNSGRVPTSNKPEEIHNPFVPGSTLQHSYRVKDLISPDRQVANPTQLEESKLSDLASSKHSNSPGGESFIEIRSPQGELQHFTPMDERSIRPKRLEF